MLCFTFTKLEKKEKKKLNRSTVPNATDEILLQGNEIVHGEDEGMMVMVVHHDGSPLLTCCFVLWTIIYEMVDVVLVVVNAKVPDMFDPSLNTGVP